MGLAVLMIEMNWLTGCEMAGFEVAGPSTCPPVMKHSREFQARAAEELALLPDGSAVVEVMGDYAVMRVQAWTCRYGSNSLNTN